MRADLGGRDTHLSDDETVAKMGHPGLWIVGDPGHPPIRLGPCFASMRPERKP